MQSKPVMLQTSRLLLKGFSPQHMAFVFENHSKDEIMKILGHQTDEDFEKEANKQKNGYAAYNRTFLLFLLIDKTTDNVIGRCGLHNWNVDHKRAELGYHITNEKDKRKGLMTEAVSAVLKYGFTELELHRMEALVGRDNVPSLQIMQKFGFVKEGLLREHYFVSGKHEDSVVFSKLKGEYFLG